MINFLIFSLKDTRKLQNSDGSVSVKIENPENCAIEIKEFHKDGARNNVMDRLLKEMEELREKYNNNFYDLQNYKEQLQSVNSARNLYQEIRKIDRIVIASLSPNNETLQTHCKISEKIIGIIQTEHATAQKELLIAKKRSTIWKQKFVWLLRKQKHKERQKIKVIFSK